MDENEEIENDIQFYDEDDDATFTMIEDQKIDDHYATVEGYTQLYVVNDVNENVVNSDEIIFDVQSVEHIEEDVASVSNDDRVCSNRELYKKRDDLKHVLENIASLPKKHQANILRKSFDCVDEDVMETLMMSNIDSINEAKVATGMINYLKTHLCYTKEEHSSFCNLVYSVCGV